MTDHGGERTPIFHITHVDNVRGIATHGLVCDALLHTVGPVRGIAYGSLKERRARTRVRLAPGGTLADYVPFHFTPRSPMLYTIWRGNVPGAEGTQPDIVHLVLSAQDVASASLPFVFTDGHPVIDFSNFYGDLADLATLDRRAIRTRQWGTPFDPTEETKRKKQAEFLVRGHVPWHLVREVAVMSDTCRRKLRSQLDGMPHQPPVSVRADWYYS